MPNVSSILHLVQTLSTNPATQHTLSGWTPYFSTPLTEPAAPSPSAATLSKEPVRVAWRPLHLQFVRAEAVVVRHLLGSISHGHAGRYGKEVWELGETMYSCIAVLPRVP